MEKCLTCGGAVVLINNNVYKCLYCDNEYNAGTSSSAPTMRPKTGNNDSGVDVFDSNIGGVLEITWADSTAIHSGSGYIISDDGYAITNTHVVTRDNGENVGKVTVRVCGEETAATVIRLGDTQHGLGKGVDLALIKLAKMPKGAKKLSFADFGSVRNGQRVFVIGNSLGYGTCITSGIVSDKLRNVNGKMLLMTDCAINGGNSGGPMFDEKGLIIGTIVSGITGAEGMNFAIPANTVIDFVNKK